MALATAIKKIATARKKYNTALAALSRRKLAKALGAVIPKGFALVWEQWTPGFNDGEPCTFTRGAVKLASVKSVGALREEFGLQEPQTCEDGELEFEQSVADKDAAEAAAASEVERAPDDLEVEEDEPEVDDEDEPSEEEQERDFSCDSEEDSACYELMYCGVRDLKWCGGPDGKQLAALKKAWAMVDDDAIISAAFGDGDGRFVIHSGGKVEQHDYDCGY